jgi:hypothetical protein
MKLSWNSKTAWLGLATLLLTLGATWIALSKVSAEVADGRDDRPPCRGEISLLLISRWRRWTARRLPSSTFFVDQAGVIQDVVVGELLSRAFIESQVVRLLAQEGSE